MSLNRNVLRADARLRGDVDDPLAAVETPQLKLSLYDIAEALPTHTMTFSPSAPSYDVVDETHECLEQILYG